MEHFTFVSVKLKLPGISLIDQTIKITVKFLNITLTVNLAIHFRVIRVHKTQA